jgi:hypothetical protein
MLCVLYVEYSTVTYYFAIEEYVYFYVSSGEKNTMTTQAVESKIFDRCFENMCHAQIILTFTEYSMYSTYCIITYICTEYCVKHASQSMFIFFLRR